MEARREERKILRCRAIVRFTADVTMVGKTIDVSRGGVCMMVPEQLNKGQVCVVRLEPSIAGVPKVINFIARVAYSICIGVEGFKVGLEITEMENASIPVLAQVMR